LSTPETSGVRDAIGLVAMVFVPMLVEARRASRNERVQRTRGGIEPAGDVYDLMRILYPATFLVMIAEGVWRSAHSVPEVLDGRMAAAGLVLFILAKALKWWAIVSLGRSWTFRVIVVPGDSPVGSGPYAWLRHPNYVAVAFELVAVALMSGARISGPLGTLLFGALMLRRITVEDLALARLRSRNER
jgi:methyltransferase